jgi:HlyD family secretion protein
VKRKWKILLAVVGLLVLAGGVVGAIRYNQRGIVTVQTGRAARQDLQSIVTASGEIKPRNYINIGSESFGRITGISVKEGDRVKKGQILARIDSVQADADFNAQRAAVRSAEADSAAAEASLKAADDSIANAQATLDRSKADLERVRTQYERTERLWKNKLVAQQDYDQRKAELEAQVAAVRESETRVAQAKGQKQQLSAQLNATQRRISQSEANLRRFDDVLDKHNVKAPLDGVVTNLPVRVGETMVVGVQNQPGSTIMTIADMSIITAEIKVDETDIVNVKLDQTADVTIDAIPGKTFKGHVIEIGNTAILRSTGVAASQSTASSQEAKDFKVVIALDNPPDDIRPGLSCTGKIITATRNSVVAIPIQALTIRQKGDLEDADKKPDEKAKSNAPPNPAEEKARKEELQGVFVINGDKAEFRKLETGITGATDIEVTKGLKDGDEIITGSYKIIRTIRNHSRIKVDNKAPVKTES